MGLAARLAAGLMAGGTVGAIGVADLAGALWPVLIVLIFWLVELLVLYRLAYTLIWRRPWLIARHWSVSSLSVYTVV